MRYKNIPLYAALIFMSSCGNEGMFDNTKSDTPPPLASLDQSIIDSPISQEEPPIGLPPVEPPPPIPPLPPVVLPPVSPPTVDPETGSTLYDFAQLAQMGDPRGYGRYRPQMPLVVSLLGKDSDESLQVNIPLPPNEMTACNHSLILSEGIPFVDKKYRFNDWWLVASNTSLIGYDPDKSVYFFWARQISDTEVGVVPTGVGTSLLNQKNPADIKINTGHSEIAYQWISRFEGFSYFPQMPGEPCMQEN